MIVFIGMLLTLFVGSMVAIGLASVVRIWFPHLFLPVAIMLRAVVAVDRVEVRQVAGC
jgi:hypothetical protein